MSNHDALCVNLTSGNCDTSVQWDADTTALAIVADGLDGSRQQHQHQAGAIPGAAPREREHRRRPGFRHPRHRPDGQRLRKRQRRPERHAPVPADHLRVVRHGRPDRPACHFLSSSHPSSSEAVSPCTRFAAWTSRLSSRSRSTSAPATSTSRPAGRRSCAATGELERARRLGAAGAVPARGARRSDRRLRSEAARSLPRLGRARHLLRGRRSAALPRQRVPAARRDLVRVPPDSGPRARLRRARASTRRRAPRRPPARPGPRHRRHGRRQDDHGRLDDRAHQPDTAAAHRHDRGPDRDSSMPTSARSSTSARSVSTPTRSTRRSGACSVRTRT